MTVVAFALWCGFLWRVRGGAWETLLRLPPGTTRARLATAALMALPLPLAGASAALAAGLAAATFLGMAMAGWGRAMDIGRVSGSRWGDAVQMSGWGLVAAFPAAAVLAVSGGAWWPMLAAGLAFGPVYALAWHLPRLPDVPRFAAGPTEWGEFVVGCALGAALWMGVP